MVLKYYFEKMPYIFIDANLIKSFIFAINVKKVCIYQFIMNNSEKIFFDLLRAGLWDKEPDLSLFKGKIVWEEIYWFSKTQALQGVVLDGVEKLPDNLKPPRNLYIKWCAEVIQTEDQNLKLDNEIVTLVELLRSRGVEPVLLKGQGISRNYINPQRRVSGDIDIFTGTKYYNKTNELLLIEGESQDLYGYKHLSFKWHDEVVENHRILISLKTPSANKKLQKHINNWHADENYETIKINGCWVSVPPIDFNIVFILIHIVEHLFGMGVGLRQICDWARMLHQQKNNINRTTALQYLEDFKLVKAARVFGALCVKYLGLPEKDLLIPYKQEDEKESELLIKDILKNGNFGNLERKNMRVQGWWLKRKILNFFKAEQRVYKFRNLAPGEVIWSPWFIIEKFVKARIFYYKVSKKGNSGKSPEKVI